MSKNAKVTVEDKEVYSSFAEMVWKRLSRIDVTKYTQQLPATKKRPEISYLPWHMAWMLLKREFPASTFEYEEDLIHQDGTVEVGVWVSIKAGFNQDEFLCNKQGAYCRLAVMDSWMNPIANPTAREVNDSRQRVLVKALAFAGLGLNIWGHDTIPVGKLNDPIDDDQLENLVALIEETDTNEETFLKWCECDKLSELPLDRYASAFGLLTAKLQRQQAENK